MPRKSFLDALSDISQIKSLEKFTKTRDMVRSGQDITSLSMSDLSRDGLLNPWILNIQEVIISTFFSGLIAVVLMYAIGMFLDAESLKEVVSPSLSQAGIFLYMVLTTYILVYASVPFKHLSNKDNKETIINSFLYVNGSYGFAQKFLAGLAASLLYHISYSFQHELEESDARKLFLLLSLSFLLIIVSMIMEYFSITKHIIHYRPLHKFDVSLIKLRVAAFSLIALPSVVISSYLILQFVIVVSRISSRDELEVAFYSLIFGILFVIGAVLFFETNRKAIIFRFSLVSSIFLRLPGCESRPASIDDRYNDNDVSLSGDGLGILSALQDFFDDTILGIVVNCSFDKCSHDLSMVFLIYGTLSVIVSSFCSYIYFAYKLLSLLKSRLLVMGR